MMVEVNVAKDILEGKARPKSTPSKPSREDSEAVKRRKAEIKKGLDIGSIETHMEKSQRAMARALGDLGSLIDVAWKRNLKEFLTDDYADAIDRIHEETVSGPKNADMGKAEKMAQGLASTALRLGSKFASLKKALDHVRGEPTVESVSVLFKDVTKFADAFHAHRQESGKLSALINTSENVPASWDDVYHRSHQIVIQYDEDFQRFSASSLKALESQVEMDVDFVSELVEREYGIKGQFPAWKKWRVPADFQDAIELVRKAK